jgi:hypothetical protein
MTKDIQDVPRVGEYMTFYLPEGENYQHMRVSNVYYEYSFISPNELGVHVYLEEIEGDPPFFRPLATTVIKDE